MSSREDQRFRYERALARELELTLHNIPYVLESRVHLNLPLVDPLFGQKLDNSSGSASVMLVVKKDVVSRPEVASVVAGASGISFKDISIMVTVTEARPPENISPVLEAGKITPEPSPSNLQQDAAKLEVPWHRAHRSLVLQIASSLVILGVALTLYLLRRGRKAEIFSYEAHQPL
jgi:type III secretory pathway lipoprotein EscJ